MTRILCSLDRRLFAFAILGVLGSGQVSWAQNEVIQLKGVSAEALFNRWAYGPSQNESGARAYFTTLLKRKIQEISRICDLTEEQKKKLCLAGNGDIARFFQGVEAKRRELEKISGEVRLVKVGGEIRLGNFQQSIAIPAKDFQKDLFDVDSLFAKTLKRTLDATQLARHEITERKKLLVQYHRDILGVVLREKRLLNLRRDQSEQFKKLLLEQTEPKSYPGLDEYSSILFQASQIPEAKIKPIFDDPQWVSLKEQFEQAKALEQSSRPQVNAR
jgi:hypothetical protein